MLSRFNRNHICYCGYFEIEIVFFEVIGEHEPDVIYHTAAHKHVLLMELAHGIKSDGSGEKQYIRNKKTSMEIGIELIGLRLGEKIVQRTIERK
ncbi:hypothetical protein [Parageobacillus thermoglucosidasius]|uniref:Uncharacterized protein n=1 Tax=Parageobacillus thermoglucosidasius TaxID=1426 RepID=A0AAN0YKY7_PARTM|nr:hypothetical protein [Parageobacillus thermoglucosidasius]ALF08815.1 hypothetical protein AOT13_01465 [Parageobacillus thermoglucosidasius]ANZ28897.1 hypothetical protein BCV53_01470 [Parageobacillus thermoglucosidasius]APM79636.1 hypothetical protein BCV54_01480 [Parageobacillus thermoglucosidasius]RDE26763.1 hypothetical protein DV712_07890 [Parageobacillus thermoglucosidasius]BDG30593.1 hypothetical protein PthBH41_03050 [Parageobacillus thermoglucosidasius]